MAIYDGNGNLIEQTVVTDNPKFDYWTQTKNHNGGVGFMANTNIDYTGTFKTQSGYATSGWISTQKDLRIKISDVSEINVAQSQVFWFNENFQKVAKADLSLDGNNSFGVSPSQGSKYLAVAFKVTSTDFTLTAVEPEAPLRITNKYAEGFWNNVSYPTDDYTYTEITKYYTAGLAENAGELRQPKNAMLEIPYLGDYDSYTMVISENPGYSNPRTINVGQYTPYVSVVNLKTETFYYVKVIGTTDNVDTVIAKYQVKTEGAVRMVTIGNISNCRDMGNKKTEKWGKIKQGLVFRTAKLDDMNASVPTDLDELGILGEIDLRNTDEIDPDYESPLTYVRAIIGSSQGLAQGFYDAFANCFSEIVTMLKADKPFLIHCKGGADRTGVICAIMEGVLGVSESDINKDYELTAFNTSNTIRNDLDDDSHWFSEGQIAMHNVEGATLADRYANILIAGGCTAQEIEDFRHIMLTDYN